MSEKLDLLSSQNTNQKFDAVLRIFKELSYLTDAKVSVFFVLFFQCKAPHLTKNSIIKDVQSFINTTGNYDDK